MSDELETALRLVLTPDLGARRAAKLREIFGSPELALSAPAREWEERAGLPKELAFLANGRQVARQITEVKRTCARSGVEMIVLSTPAYPERLALIHDPPQVLFVQGEGSLTELSRLSVAVVGTRSASSSGLAFARRLSADLARAGATVVSGLAFGVDVSAHEAALEAEGSAIAVLPGPLDKVHPWAHQRQAERIRARGVLVSEHPPGTSITKGMFVGRNRIISGLAAAVAIIEAGSKSGALSTAEFAVEQDRSLFVMPGRPDDPRVAGSLRLLKEGAYLLTSAEDILLDLQLPAYPPPGPQLPAALIRHRALFMQGAALDTLAVATGLDTAPLLAILGKLELEGTVYRDAEGRYRIR